MKSLFWTLLLLMMIIYVFGILFTQATTQHAASDESSSRDQALLNNFGTLPRAMLSLFKTVSGGEDWGLISDSLKGLGWVWTALFLLFVSFTFFAVLNVVTGVFCQNAIASAAHDQDVIVQSQLASKETYIEQLKMLFLDLDGDASHTLTIDEFEDRFNDTQVQAYFASMELPSEDAWALFKILDENDSHTINVEEFVTGCLRLKGQAKRIDIAALRYEQKWTSKKLTNFMTYVEEQFKNLPSKLEPAPCSMQTCGAESEDF